MYQVPRQTLLGLEIRVVICGGTVLLMSVVSACSHIRFVVECPVCTGTACFAMKECLEIKCPCVFLRCDANAQDSDYIILGMLRPVLLCVSLVIFLVVFVLSFLLITTTL